MAFSEENGNVPMTMLVSPTAGGMPYYAQGNSGFGGFGNDGWWVILLFLLLIGNNGFGNGYGNGAPVIVDNNTGVQRGFDQASVMGGINSIQSGICGLGTQLCNGFAGVNATINSTASTAEVAANARQMANMQQIFGLQSQFADCCCENRLGTADLKYTIATENCADRAALSDGIRDILAATQAQTQTILDKMCQDKIDAKNEKIVELQNQLNMASLRESQVAQNAFIQQGLANEVDALYNRLNNCPVSTVPVYGKQPIFTQTGCGCGCGA